MKTYQAGIIILFMTFLIACSTCTPEEDCHNKYRFMIPVSFTPVIDTIHIGDTLWVGINIPSTLQEQNSEQDKDVSAYPFSVDANLTLYDSTGFYPAENTFLYIHSIGKFIPYGSTWYFLRAVFQKEADGSQILQVGCVPTQKGLYRLEFSSLPTDGVFEQGYYEKNCLEEFTFGFKMNDNLDSNNYQLVNLLPLSIIGAYDAHEFNGCYAFRVVE